MRFHEIRVNRFEDQDVHIAQLQDKNIIDEEQIQRIARELNMLQGQPGARATIIVDFSHVKYMSSSFIGKLMTLEKRTTQHEQKLILCGIQPKIYEVLLVTNLHRLFSIKNDLDEAVRAVGLSPSAIHEKMRANVT